MKKGLRPIEAVRLSCKKGTDPDLMKKGLRRRSAAERIDEKNGPRPYEEGIKTPARRGMQLFARERTQTL